VKQGDVLPYGWRRLGATSRSAFLKAVREDVKEIVKGGWPTRLPDTLYERELLPPDLDLSEHALTYHLSSRKDCAMAALWDAYADNAIELEALCCRVGKQFMLVPKPPGHVPGSSTIGARLVSDLLTSADSSNLKARLFNTCK
jgi:hypothetical protein